MLNKRRFDSLIGYHSCRSRFLVESLGVTYRCSRVRSSGAVPNSLRAGGMAYLTCLISRITEFNSQAPQPNQSALLRQRSECYGLSGLYEMVDQCYRTRRVSRQE